MAKGNMLLGTLRGSIGDVTFSRSAGQQVAKAKVTSVKNPRSEAQMVQRMIQATVAQAYSAMKRICDHSFEGIQTGLKSQSYFNSVNASALRASIDYNSTTGAMSSNSSFALKGGNRTVPNSYIIAKGSLIPVLTDAPALNSLNGNSAGDFDNVVVIAELESNAFVMEPFLKSLGAEVGDWFTFCFLTEHFGSDENSRGRFRFNFIRLMVVRDQDNHLNLVNTLNSNGAAPVSIANLLTHLFVDNKNYGCLDLNVVFPEWNDYFKWGVVASAAIHSRKMAGGAWLRSDATLFVRNMPAYMQETGLLDLPMSVTDALETWMGEGTQIGTGSYVLNGGNA